jgi:phosphatidylethanolamine/phosphatidyl-N-methylethanolamine N-methyltransferase
MAFIHPPEQLGTSGVRALSVAPVGNAFVDRVYANLSPIYDVVFGPPLQPGRVAAVRRLRIRPGDQVLEVGVGTGLNASLYPRDCRVTAVDFSASMLEKAYARIEREGLRHVQLLEMDAAKLMFADESFDSVCAPYLISVVADPIAVVREMWRVCRPGGRIVILNHFRSAHLLLSRVERAVSPLTVHIGFKADLDLPGFLAQAQLSPVSIEKVNYPRLWSLVTCLKDGHRARI